MAPYQLNILPAVFSNEGGKESVFFYLNGLAYWIEHLK